MKKTRPARRKRPPAAGTLVGVRLQPELLDRLDRWMTDHDLLSRPEAVRQILQKTLGAEKKR
jgi:metal-responsive CopG/Arc/MetJ family transcriptional regulator